MFDEEILVKYFGHPVRKFTGSECSQIEFSKQIEQFLNNLQTQVILGQFIDRCTKQSKKKENINNLIQEDKIQKVQKDLSIKRR